MNIKNKRVSRDAKFAIDKEVIWSGIIYDLTMLKSLKFKETNKLMLKNNAG